MGRGSAVLRRAVLGDGGQIGRKGNTGRIHGSSMVLSRSQS